MGRLLKNFPEFARHPDSNEADEDDDPVYVFADDAEEINESVDRKRRHRSGHKPPWMRKQHDKLGDEKSWS